MTMPRRKPASPSGGPTAAEKTWTPILADWKMEEEWPGRPRILPKASCPGVGVLVLEEGPS